MNLLPSDIPCPEVILDATLLTDYAVSTRYPGEEEPLTEEDYREAVRLAEAVVAWASEHLDAR
ncbi:MAG: HEPN domain-containing protein [Armatimonadota bacterium]|nr:HEPN domain-containing protein [Armatimonadota bacterium]